uniref:Uncharacterized protein n=1 Tax=Sphaerodactylus townsendi TaxID=933632 RepID=A0ACB8EGQ7_9SAUR
MVLVACLVLCLGPGAETLICTKCGRRTNEECLRNARDQVCWQGAVCEKNALYLGDKLQYVNMACKEKSSPCHDKELKGGYRLTVKCCSDRDFCNKDLFSA